MENASKALIMAGSTLLAVVLFALVVYFFKNMGNVPTQQEEQLQTEQLAKFNLEYEVYDKTMMYGVDVISCLNKAKSNNEKYVNGNGFLQGNQYSDEFSIDVVVTLKTALEESLQIYAMKEVSPGKYKEQEMFGSYSVDEKMKDIFDFDPDKQLTSFSLESKLNLTVNTLNTTEYASGEHHLKEDMEHNDGLYKLLAHSNNMKQTVKNTEEILAENNGWTKAIWSTYLYSLKTKRFQCKGITYSNKTGRVDCITFEEI